ncbi:MAG: ABC transporter permease [Sphaerochaeta sp.]|nr:ABC transporter permease [Sphaerochaeta sp.]
MIGFHLKRASHDLIGQVILILFPLVLIFFFDFLYRNIGIETGMEIGSQNRATVLAIGFALTFQIYASAMSFETLSEDLFTPMHDRLFSTPAEGRSLVLSVLLSGTVVSFMQSCVVLVFSMLILGASFPNFPFVLAIILLSVLFNQLLGTVLLLFCGSPKAANIVTTVYGSVVPMLVGLYFPLPKSALVRFLRLYGTPMSLANTASLGVMEGDWLQAIITIGPLVGLSVVLFVLLKGLVRRVVA